MKVKELYEIINEIAPFEAAESYDNVGILCGSEQNDITGIYVCLDVNSAAIEAAKAAKCNTIVSHHPILFHGRKNLREDDPEGAFLANLIRNNMNLIAAHTNYDNAEYGVSYQIAEHMELMDIETIVPGVKTGTLEKEMSFEEFQEYLTNKFSTVVRGYGKGIMIRKVAVCGGAGGEFFMEAIKSGADAYVTGEMRYHDSLEAVDYHMASFTIGHDSSEIVAIRPLAKMIQERINGIKIIACD